jgi:arylsulfatase A
MPITRRRWLATTLASAAATAQQRTRRPNVVLIMSDDHGYGDLSCHGNTVLRTPHLDGLASQSTEFSRFYVSPVCAPTRASLLTGRYNVRCGVHGVTGGRETMPVEEVTVAETFRKSGYRTSLIGKWHLGELYPNVPHAQGFDEYIGFRTGHWNNYFDSTLEKNGKPYPTRGFITDFLTDEALAFCNRNRENPFLLYVAYNAPHSPFQAPENALARFREAKMPIELASVYAMIENLDSNIGRLLAGLDRLQLSDNTIVVFLTDNGPAGQRFNAGLRAAKGSVYEGGVRVPMFIRWPGRIESGRKVDTIAAHIDIYPTLTDLCGVERPRTPAIDGLSLRPLLESKAASWPDRSIFTHREVPRQPDAMYPGAIRTQRYNLINGKELYDISSDPGETTDLSAKLPEKVRELRGRYEDWFKTAISERGFRHLPLPVGHPEENPAVLPATQAYFDGELKFHNVNGYAHDWITGWSRVEDSVWWEIDVARAGVFDIALRYLCAADSLGAEISVTAGGIERKASITKATPTQPLADRNLVEIAHYKTMDWGTLPAGSFALAKGRTSLKVRALAKRGRVVMDLKEVVMTMRQPQPLAASAAWRG